MNTENQDSTERRSYKQDGCEYLLNDEAKTAWIAKGPRIGRCRRYRIPDHVVIQGECYVIESVECGAFKEAKCLEHLNVPDSILFLDEYNFTRLPNLKSIYIGRGLEHLDTWVFGHCPKLASFVISKDNPNLCVEHGIVYTKDGECAVTSPFKPRRLNLKEGVERIGHIAFWWNENLEEVLFPSTLKQIGDNSLAGCRKLRAITLPEGFEECVVQSFQDNEGLETVDLPSTMTNYGTETFYNCPRLQTLIIRAKQVMKLESPLDFASHCTLKVPAELIADYKAHPYWGRFKSIAAIQL